MNEARSLTTIRRALVGLLVAAGLGVGPLLAGMAYAAGESGISIQNMTMDIRPEYDTSDVLITYDFTLTNTSATPYGNEIQFHVPKGATNQVHICEQVNGNKHAVCRPYKTTEEGDSTLMSWKPSNPIGPGQSYPIYVEYYYNPIQGTADKQIDFLYHPSYPVQTLNLSVLQPARSSNWRLNPAPASSGGGENGMTRYFYTMQNLSADKPVNLTIQYTKADKNPSVATKPTDTSAVTGMSTGGKVALGGLVGALFSGLLFLGLRRPEGKRNPPADRRAAPPSVPVRPQPAPAPRPREESGSQRRATPRLLSVAEQKQQARMLLLQGKISESTYHEILADLGLDTGEAR